MNYATEITIVIESKITISYDYFSEKLINFHQS